VSALQRHVRTRLNRLFAWEAAHTDSRGRVERGRDSTVDVTRVPQSPARYAEGSRPAVVPPPLSLDSPRVPHLVLERVPSREAAHQMRNLIVRWNKRRGVDCSRLYSRQLLVRAWSHSNEAVVRRVSPERHGHGRTIEGEGDGFGSDAG
jgi:hypothetical protein